MTSETITVVTRLGGTETVQADVDGALAIHRSLGTIDDSWTLTHVPTGHVIAMSLRKERLVHLVPQLQHLDWSFTNPHAQPRQIQAEGVEIVRAWMGRTTRKRKRTQRT